MKVAVVGAGIAGRLTAWMLLEKGASVTLFERGQAVDTTASFAAAGMLAPYSEAVQASEQVVQMGVETLSWWDTFCARHQIECAPRGTVVVASDARELEHFACKILAVVPTAPVVRLDRQQLRVREPSLAHRFHHALFIADETHLVPEQVLEVLLNSLRSRAEVHFGTEALPLPHGAVRIGNRELLFDCVVDARGIAARDRGLPLRGVRGELVHLLSEDVALTHAVRFLHARHPIYVVPRKHGHFVVGATTVESEDFSPISVRGAHELFSAACEIHPAFAEARVVKTIAQCRPATPVHEPFVAMSGRIIDINGLFRHGYMVGPALAARATNVVLQMTENTK